MKTFLHSFFVFALLFAAGCDDRSAPEDRSVSYLLQDYTLGDTWQWGDTPYGEVRIVRSQEELAHCITPNETLPADIDFSKYSLLLLKGLTANLYHGIHKSLYSEGETLCFNIDIYYGEIVFPTGDYFRIACLATPPIPDGTEVQIKYNEIYDLPD